MKFKNAKQIARFAIEYFLNFQEMPNINSELVTDKLKEKRACFVTIYVKKELRGCIGTYIARNSLYSEVATNAVNAAFFDSRFPPLRKEELVNLNIHVSVLTSLKKICPKNNDELQRLLKEKKPGLMIESFGLRAIFLPQVWEELKKPEDFLYHLCFKAGLSPDCWQKKKINYWVFYTK